MVTVQIAPRRLGPADWVTTARLALAGVVGVLVAAALAGVAPAAPLAGPALRVLVAVASVVGLSLLR